MNVSHVHITKKNTPWITFIFWAIQTSDVITLKKKHGKTGHSLAKPVEKRVPFDIINPGSQQQKHRKTAKSQQFG